MATAATASDIPIVDFAGLNSDPAARSATVATLRGAFESIGFLYLLNHGVPQPVVDALFAQSQRFFALPQATKDALRQQGGGNNPGYDGVGAQALEVGRPGDLKEMFQASADQSSAGSIWPETLPSFREAVLAFRDAATRACSQIMRAIALALGLPEHYFEPYYERTASLVRLLHYPPLGGAPMPGQLRAGAHTDFGGLSLLFPGVEGGLEIQAPDGTWLPAPALAGAAIVNVGDLIQRWTNDLFRSAPHRVVNPEGEAMRRDRYSIVLFHALNPDAVIACLEPCQGPDRPARYPPITAGEHIRARARASRGQSN